ncbi:heterokaryon incompatibility protein-domain-containing protein [Lasiosphaeria hispida]|uniref:Heterokaryon incompatibility protein-domain-containing protein n=1 Tax=Lasiosphaeria hispida TaxID=260671 RepID=A0AAJ0HBB6_9PEZI|nr:heterokaryon incompatibility protein-domain-containing protein [Lasiosphaeria hispida]
MRLLAEWLRTCDCGPPAAPAFRPTRVLDVGDDGPGPKALRLHCTAASSDGYDYVALSHCWGRPTAEEWERVCTHPGNFETRCRNLPFIDMPKTFQDAITVTRKLGKRFLWIDSLCIIQGDEADWERESQLMESIFSSAYCTLSATSARGFNDGFLLPRHVRLCMPVPNAPKEAAAAAPLWLCETVDDFRADVEMGVVNQRGWVLQERVLSRRTIYFTSSQTYFECGGGVRCETMTRLRNPKAAIFGDHQFPAVMLRQKREDQTRLLQQLFETYSSLALTVPTDRAVAIAGLERRLERGGFGTAPYGFFGDHYRGLLWERRGASPPLQRIKYPARGRVPSWSWMAYDGEIQYVDVPEEEMEWLCRPAASIELGSRYSRSGRRLKIAVDSLSLGELREEPWRLSLDDPGSVDLEDLMCAVVGRHMGNNDGVQYYAVIVTTRLLQGYERVGIGRLQGRHIMHQTPRLGGYLV